MEPDIRALLPTLILRGASDASHRLGLIMQTPIGATLPRKIAPLCPVWVDIPDLSEGVFLETSTMADPDRYSGRPPKHGRGVFILVVMVAALALLAGWFSGFLG